MECLEVSLQEYQDIMEAAARSGINISPNYDPEFQWELKRILGEERYEAALKLKKDNQIRIKVINQKSK